MSTKTRTHLLVAFLCLVLFGLGGCGTKNISGTDPFAVVDTSSRRSSGGKTLPQKTGTAYLPADDG
ncbi:MAG: hypothetical protein RR014_05860, partial [Bilophila sp.]